MQQFRFSSPSLFPPVIKNLFIINVLFFLAQMVVGQSDEHLMYNWFALHDIHSVYFKPHQLLTHMFMHGGFSHIIFNMIGLWMFGVALEHRFGSKKFLLFYLASGLGAAILHLVILYFEMEPVMSIFHQLTASEQADLLYASNFRVNVPTVGASGAVFGCLAAFGYLYPNSIIYVDFLFPVKAKWFVLFYAGFELMLAIQHSAGDTVAHFAHLGGAITGFILVWIWNKNRRNSFYR